MYGSACGSVKRIRKCPARHSSRKIAPYVSETSESRSDCWMKMAANPAVSSNDAGISAISSRLRALMGGGSRVELSAFELDHEVLRVVLGAQLVIREGRAPRRRDRLQ